MGTSTLSRFQRGALAQLVSEGHHTYQDMADALGVAKSTISYELDRVKPYDPELAQQDADHKRRACGRHSILTPSLTILITNHLRLTWSPGAIATAFNLSTASIYNWLKLGWYLSTWLIYLIEMSDSAELMSIVAHLQVGLPLNNDQNLSISN